MNRPHSLDNLWVCIIVCVMIAASITMMHVKAVDMPNRDFQSDWHRMVIAGEAPAPDQYRIVMFAAAEGLRRVTGIDLTAIYAFLRLVLTASALVVLYRYLRFWFSSSVSTIGILLIGALLPATFFGYKMQVTDPAHFLLFLLVFRALQVNSMTMLYLAAPIAAANRESAVFLIPFCIAAWYGTISARTMILRTAALAVVMLGVLIPIHLFYGYHAPYSPVFTLTANLTRPGSLLFPGVFLGWLAIAALTNIGSKPMLLRRFVLPAALFVVVHLLVALVSEARLFLPLVPVVLPLALYSLSDVTVHDLVSTTSC